MHRHVAMAANILPYSHHDTNYWDGGGIVETRKKRPRISTNN